jgi:hypothetical protein
MTNIGGENRWGQGLQRTNAARASHPSRIVVVDVLNCRLSPRRKIIAQLHSEECFAFDAPLRLALQGYDSAFPSLLEEGFLSRPQSPGTGTLDMRRISPGDSLSKITGNAEPLLGIDSEPHTLLTFSTLRQRKN